MYSQNIMIHLIIFAADGNCRRLFIDDNTLLKIQVKKKLFLRELFFFTLAV